MSGARGPRRFRGTPVLRISALCYRQRRRLNGSSGIRVGNGSRVEIESTEVEVDRGTEAVPVSESPGSSLEGLDLGVEPLGHGVGDAGSHGVEDAPQVLAKGARHFFDRRQARADRPGVPGAQACSASSSVSVSHTVIASSLIAQARAVFKALWRRSSKRADCSGVM